LIEEGKKPL